MTDGKILSKIQRTIRAWRTERTSLQDPDQQSNAVFQAIEEIEDILKERARSETNAATAEKLKRRYLEGSQGKKQPKLASRY